MRSAIPVPALAPRKATGAPSPVTNLPIQTAPAPTAPGELELLRLGDEEAWASVFRQLWPIVLRAAQHPAACLTAGEAEEIASEALALLVPRAKTVGSLDELKALAATIAHRRAISLARAKSAAKRAPAAWVLERNGGSPGGQVVKQDDTISDLELAEMALLLRQALDGLDPLTQRLLREKTADGLSYQELSEKYRMPLGTVCAKIARSLHQIRKRLELAPRLMKELRNFLR
jgi:RNA polymerase sigma factor (sigma-70 family)